MKVTVFTKTGKKHDGTTFKKFVTTLTRKDGEKVYADVKFPNDILNEYQASTGQVITFPVVITFKGNMSTKHTTTDDGNEYTNHYLWIKEIISVEPYVDTSLDDFNFDE